MQPDKGFRGKATFRDSDGIYHKQKEIEPFQHHWQVAKRKMSEKLNAMEDIAYTAENLWNDCCDFFEWCDKNPIRVKKVVASGREYGKTFFDETPRPYTIKGICLHSGFTENWFKNIATISDEDASSMGEMVMVARQIISIVYLQNMEYMLAGVYNPVFTQKVIDKLEEAAKASQKTVIEIVSSGNRLATSENDILKDEELYVQTFGKPKR